MRSDAGALLPQVYELNRAAETFNIDWGDVSATMGKGLDILKQELNKLHSEHMESAKQKPASIDWAKVKRSNGK
ncbi:MAG TPA: hypothetical protein VGN17_04005 [Bryobacteraceae bacterium]|jgi:hypothetical protein